MLPLAVLITFGLIEFGLIFKNELTVSSASGAGAREGAALSKQPDYQNEIRDVVVQRVQSAGPEDGDRLVVYKADPSTGLPETLISETQIWDDCDDCYRFVWQSDDFQPVPGRDWPASEQDACRDLAGLDQLGVYLEMTHDHITPLVGDLLGGGSRKVKDRSVYALEPKLPGECEAA